MEEITTQPGSPARIEPATWRDLNPLRAIEKVCFPKDAWPLWDLIGVLTLPNIIRLKASVDELMVGFIAGDIRPRETIAWIATVGVLPEYQRRGIGEALILACEKQVSVPRVRLSVRISNQGAIHLYYRLGYQDVGTWPAYYADREDALVMEKIL
jgi:ribosomal protein S18 acetylase RimI-like enzyme